MEEMDFSQIDAFNYIENKGNRVKFYIIEVIKKDGQKIQFARIYDNNNLKDIINNFNLYIKSR